MTKTEIDIFCEDYLTEHGMPATHKQGYRNLKLALLQYINDTVKTEIHKTLPLSYYAGLPPLERIDKIVKDWNYAIRINGDIEKKLNERDREIVKLRVDIEKLENPDWFDMVFAPSDGTEILVKTIDYGILIVSWRNNYWCLPKTKHSDGYTMIRGCLKWRPVPKYKEELTM